MIKLIVKIVILPDMTIYEVLHSFRYDELFPSMRESVVNDLLIKLILPFLHFLSLENQAMERKRKTEYINIVK